jgi:hypothetical protein
MKKPILEIRKIGDGIYNYALYRSDTPSPIIKGISKPHATHIMKILRSVSDLPFKITPIINWFDYDYIVHDVPSGDILHTDEILPPK